MIRLQKTTEAIRDELLEAISEPTGERFHVLYQVNFGQFTRELYDLEDHPEKILHAKLSDFAKVGEVIAHDEEDVYQNMQGDFWSPTGEARPVIRELGLKHTSMSVGDVLVCDGKARMVAPTGFVDITLDIPGFYLDDDDKADRYRKAMTEYKELDAAYGKGTSCQMVLETLNEYLHGTAEVEELGVSIGTYTNIIRDLLAASNDYK